MTQTVQGVDPRTGSVVGTPIPLTTPDELAVALSAAAAASESFGTSAPPVRIAFLHALADAFDAARDELVPLAMAETGLPEARLTGEVARTSGQLRLFADVVADGGYLDVIVDPPTSSRPDLRRWREPLGPVLVYAASNFPFAFSVLGGDTASALAAGCPVLVKAHPSHPGVSLLTARLASSVVSSLGLPDGVFGVLFGDEIGVAALRDPRVKAAGFTGSTTGGRFLFDVATGRPDPIPFYGELGSINPSVVTPAAVSARASSIAEGFVASMSLGTGQFCTKPGLLFVPAGSELVELLAAAVSSMTAGPLLNARIGAQLASGRSALEASAAVSVVGCGAAAPSDGTWAVPTLYRVTARDLVADPALLAAEYFGPNAIVVEYSSAEELVEALGVVEGSLTATIHAEPSDDVARAVFPVLRAKAGRVLHNGWPTGVAVTWAMQHGGPWPSTTASTTTSVGATAIERWVRPVCYQDVPSFLLPDALHDDNPWHLPRRVDGHLQLPG